MLFTLLLPLFLVSALGALLARGDWLGGGWAHGVNALTARLFIPALLFGGTYKHGLPAAVSWRVLAAYYAALLAVFCVMALGSRRGGNHAGRALAATYSNTIFVGIPVLRLAFGEASLQYAFPIIAFHGLTAFTAYYALASGGGRLLSAIGNAVLNPIVLSLLAGLALNLSGAVLPHWQAAALEMLAGAALPCALLALGASLAQLRIARWGETVLVVVVKLVLLPALVLGLSVFVMHLRAEAVAALVVLASCPVAVNVAAVVQADGKDLALPSSAILLSSLACMATMPLWLWLLGVVA